MELARGFTLMHEHMCIDLGNQGFVKTAKIAQVDRLFSLTHRIYRPYTSTVAFKSPVKQYAARTPQQQGRPARTLGASA